MQRRRLWLIPLVLVLLAVPVVVGKLALMRAEYMVMLADEKFPEVSEKLRRDKRVEARYCRAGERVLLPAETHADSVGFRVICLPELLDRAEWVEPAEE